MASAAQKQAFVSTYGPYANQAGGKLGVNGNVVLAQWAFESDYGTQGSAAASGNMAGINYPGSTTGTNYRGYSNPQAFTDSYVSTLQNPRYASALNTGNDSNAFVSGLKNGGYFTGDQSQYTSGVASNVHTIAGLGGSGTTVAGGGDGISGFGSSGAVNSDGSPVNDPNLGGTVTPQNSQVLDPTTGEPIGGGSTLGTGVGGASGSPGSSGLGSTGILGALADTGYIPPAQSGGPYTFGLAGGVVASINTWITGIETAVGNWMTKTLGEAFGSMVNWFARAGLIILGFILLAFALWRILDPSGEKTKAVMTEGMAAA